jgi:hypothetical protein
MAIAIGIRAALRLPPSRLGEMSISLNQAQKLSIARDKGVIAKLPSSC